MFESQREHDDWWEQAFKRMTRGMEDHSFNHYNNALGCQIYSKEHYKSELKKRGMLPYDTAQEIAQDYDKRNPRKEYGELSPKAMDIIQSLKFSADKNGNIKLGGRAIEALKEIGAIRPHEHAPNGELVGGFN